VRVNHLAIYVDKLEPTRVTFGDEVRQLLANEPRGDGLARTSLAEEQQVRRPVTFQGRCQDARYALYLVLPVQQLLWQVRWAKSFPVLKDGLVVEVLLEYVLARCLSPYEIRLGIYP
jgi:hypothetical protein